MRNRREPQWYEELGVLLCFGLIGVGGMGCSRQPALSPVTFSDLVGRLTNIEQMARLDVDNAMLVSSYDRTGGNDDFNNFLRDADEKGWSVMADLKGPGYISRFWFTGGEASQRIRLYFDGEKKPRVDMTVGEWCGGRDPCRPPLAIYENYCYYSLIPILYRKRLVIETTKGGYKPGNWPRLFYQINYSLLPPRTPVESFSGAFSEADRAAMESVRRAWNEVPSNALPAASRMTTVRVALPPGSVSNALMFTGPAMICSLNVTPDFNAIPSALKREESLRNLILRIQWNRESFSSVETPLGDLFGNLGRRSRFRSMFFGMAGDTLESRFPMPFESAAQIQLENQGDQPITLEVGVEIEPLKAWDSKWGYFHSGWHRTGPNDVGAPHPILRTEGRGKYVGCILGVTALDRSYWILEGDESIRKDKETVPGWLGTGLEDYFNGGWYYQNVLARPLHGLSFKAPFRTVQYRVHLVDPVCFNSSLAMQFERGPKHASLGWMESVAFYYLDRPRPVFARLGTAAERVRPADPMAQVTVMTELWNFERFGDYTGAVEFVDAFLEQFRDFPFADVLRLRQAAYAARTKGWDMVRPVFERAAVVTNSMVGSMAKTQLWFQENSRYALLGAYCNTRTKIFLDGREVGETLDPERMSVWGLTLAPGRHVLALQAVWHPYPDWVQVCLRMHSGDAITTPAWKCAINPSGDWASPDYDDSAWSANGGTGVKGPPEEPFVWVVPDLFVDMQSKAIGLRPMVDWTDHRGFIVYRHVFRIP